MSISIRKPRSVRRFFFVFACTLCCMSLSHKAAADFSWLFRAGSRSGLHLSTEYDFRFRRIMTEAMFQGTTGKIRYKRYEHIGPDKASVIFVNGYGSWIESMESLFTARNEYPGRKVPKAETLADIPVTFFTFDHAGHGKSDGLAGHIDSFDTFVEDLKRLIDHIRELRNHRHPIFLMGLSMGGLVSIRFADRYPEYVDGLIFISPLFGMPPEFSEETLQAISSFYVQAGLEKLCVFPPEVDSITIGNIALCHSDPSLSACMEDPSLPDCSSLTECLLHGYSNDCGLPPIDFASLQTAFQMLYTLQDGCDPIERTPEEMEAYCMMGDPGYGNVSTDFDLCMWSIANPMFGPTMTFGWPFTALSAIDEINPALNVPTLLLSTPTDTHVDQIAHAEICSQTPDCTYMEFISDSDRDIYWSHNLLADEHREQIVATIRDFIITIRREITC